MNSRQRHPIRYVGMACAVMLCAAAVPYTDSGTSPTNTLFRKNDMMCGVNSLYLVLKANGIECDLDGLAKLVSVDSEKGSSSRNILAAARKLGLPMRAMTLHHAKDLASIPLPAIVHFRHAHFAVVSAVDDARVTILNAPRIHNTPIADFEREWTGLVLCNGSDRRTWLGHMLLAIGFTLLAALLVFPRLRLGPVRNHPATIASAAASGTPPEAVEPPKSLEGSEPSARSIMRLTWASLLGQRQGKLRSVPLAVVAVMMAFMACPRPAPEQSAENAPPEAVAVSHDFGTVIAGDEKNHDFLVENKTNYAWKMGKPKSSCGCTVAKVAPETVEPGGTLVLSVSLRARRKHDLQREHVYVETGIERPKAIQAIVQAKPDFESEWSPERIRLRAIVGDPAHASVKLWLKDDVRGSYKLLTWKATHDFVSFEEKRQDAENIEWVFGVPAGIPKGVHSGVLRAETSLQYPAMIEIPYDVFVDSALSVVPPRVVISRAAIDMGQEAIEIQLQSRKPIPTDTQPSATSDIPGVSLDFIEGESPQARTIHLRANPAELPAAPRSGCLDIDVGLPYENTLRVPVVIVQ